MVQGAMEPGKNEKQTFPRLLEKPTSLGATQLLQVWRVIVLAHTHFLHTQSWFLTQSANLHHLAVTFCEVEDHFRRCKTVLIQSCSFMLSTEKLYEGNA